MNKLCASICWCVLIILVGCDRQAPVADAVVDHQGVRTGGQPVFATIEAALEAAPQQADRPHRILIRAGDYYEQLVVDKRNIQLLGEGPGKTRIYYDAFAGQPDGNGEPLGTRRTATVQVLAPGVQLNSLTVENNFDYIANDALADGDPNKLKGTQAVALYLDGDSDRFVGSNLELLGHQDTLFVDQGRAWFDNSRIAGSVDFIFGAGNAVFTESDIVTRPRGRVRDTHGYITAPSTDIGSEYGFTFINCQLLREQGVPDDSMALGRPWHPTKTFDDGRYADPDAVGKVVFINTYMDAHILEQGWAAMSGTARDGGNRVWFHPEDSRFFEYGSHGPGAHKHNGRRYLSEKQVGYYSVDAILEDWQP